MWLLILLTWIEYFLSSAVTRTERAVDLEVVGVIQEGSTQGEQHSLKITTQLYNYIYYTAAISVTYTLYLHFTSTYGALLYLIYCKPSIVYF